MIKARLLIIEHSEISKDFFEDLETFKKILEDSIRFKKIREDSIRLREVLFQFQFFVCVHV